MVILLRQIVFLVMVGSVLIASVLLLGQTMPAELEIEYQVWGVRAYTHYIRDLRRDLHMNLGGTRCFDALPDSASQYRGVEVWLEQVRYEQPQNALAALRC